MCFSRNNYMYSSIREKKKSEPRDHESGTETSICISLNPKTSYTVQVYTTNFPKS